MLTAKLADARAARRGSRRARLAAVRDYASLRAASADDAGGDGGPRSRWWGEIFRRLDEALALDARRAELDRLAGARQLAPVVVRTVRWCDPDHTVRAKQAPHVAEALIL